MMVNTFFSLFVLVVALGVVGAVSTVLRRPGMPVSRACMSRRLVGSRDQR